MKFLEDKFRDVLGNNEPVFWVGTPNFWIWTSFGVPILFFGLIWGIFDINFIILWLSNDALRSDYYFVPLMIFHSFPCWGSILYMIWLVLSHNNVVYTFTDKRIIIRSGLIGIDYQIIDYDKIYFMQVNINPLEKLFDVGSILFNIGIVANNSVMPKRFCGIENPCEVLRRIKEISLDSNTDLNHPNTNRPENNTN